MSFRNVSGKCRLKCKRFGKDFCAVSSKDFLYPSLDLLGWRRTEQRENKVASGLVKKTLKTLQQRLK